MKKITIFLFGDSITRGSFDTEAGGWAERIKIDANVASVKNKFDPIITVFNMGIGGNNTNDLVKRFKFETEQRLIKGGDTYFVFSFGTNDAAINVETGKFAVDVELYAKNLKQVITEARIYSNNIVFLSSPPVIDEITKSASLVGKSRINADIERYNSALKSVCEEQKVEIIDLFAIFKKHENMNQLYVEDGLHPDSKGHGIIHLAVKEYLLNKGLSYLK